MQPTKERKMSDIPTYEWHMVSSTFHTELYFFLSFFAIVLIPIVSVICKEDATKIQGLVRPSKTIKQRVLYLPNIVPTLHGVVYVLLSLHCSSKCLPRYGNTPAVF